MEHKLFIDGQWVDGGPLLEVTNKYSGEVIAALPTARQEQVDAAIAAAEHAAPLMAEIPAYRRGGNSRPIGGADPGAARGLRPHHRR